MPSASLLNTPDRRDRCPALAQIRTFCPSRVTLSCPRTRSSSSRPCWKRPCFSCISARVAVSGFRMTSPLPPSTAVICPSSLPVIDSPTPNTAGIPRFLMRIAVWELALPADNTTPRIFLVSRCMTSSAARSSAARTTLS